MKGAKRAKGDKSKKVKQPFLISDQEVEEINAKLEFLVDKFVELLTNDDLIPKARSICVFEILESLTDPKERFVGMLILTRVVSALVERQVFNSLGIEFVEDGGGSEESPGDDGGSNNDGSSGNGQPN